MLGIFAAGNAGNSLTGPGYSKNALVVGSVATGNNPVCCLHKPGLTRSHTGPNRHVVGGTSPRVGTNDYRFKPDVVSGGDNLNLGGCGQAMGETRLRHVPESS